jgi:hypothetical protein
MLLVFLSNLLSLGQGCNDGVYLWGSSNGFERAEIGHEPLWQCSTNFQC